MKGYLLALNNLIRWTASDVQRVTFGWENTMSVLVEATGNDRKLWLYYRKPVAVTSTVTLLRR